MNLCPAIQTLQLIAWFLALAELILGLYILLLNVWHTSNRHVSGLLLFFAINHFALGLMVGATDATQAVLPTYLLAATSPAINAGLLLIAVVLLKPRWLRGRWRVCWWLVYGLVFLPILLTMVDVGLGTRLWYTGFDAETYVGGYVPLPEYTAGSLSLLIRVLNFYGTPVVTIIPLLYVVLRDKDATPLARYLAWLLLAGQVAGVTIQMGLRGLLGPATRVIITGFVFVLAYAYAGFRQIVSERCWQRGRLQTRLTALILVITVPILVAVVAFVSASAEALIEQVAVQQPEAGLLSGLRQFQRVSWTVLTVGVALLLVLAWLTIRQTFRPIVTLTETADAIAAGDLTRSAPVESEDEVGSLARAFNSMTGQLRDLISGLEQRVADRTRDLSVSEKRFRDVVESMADWVWEMDAAGRYTYCSESVVGVLGYAPEEILGETPFEFMSPEEAARVGKVFAGIAADKQPIVDLENRNLTKDGQEVMLLTNGVPILDSEGYLLGYRGVDKDITERKRAEEALRERAEIIDSMPDGVLLFDIEGKVVLANQSYCRLMGLERKEVEGKFFMEIPGIERQETKELERYIPLFQEALDKGFSGPVELTILTRDGRMILVGANGAVIRDSRGNPIRLIVVIRDITERKQVEEEIKRRGEELEALREISLVVTAQLELDQVLLNVVERSCRLLDVSAGGVYLVDKKMGDLELVVSHGFTRDYTGTQLAPGEGVAGRVLQSGMPLVVDDYCCWEGRSPDWEAEPLTAVLGVPLKRGEQVIGVLTFDEMAEARDFDEHDVWLATLFANQAAIAIENARFYEEQQRRLYDLSLLHEVSARVSASLDPQKVLERIVQGTVEAVGADAASINLLIAPGKAQMVTSVGLSERFEWHTDVRPAGTTMTVIRTGEPLMIPDVAQRPEMVKPLVLEEGIQSFIVLPLPGREGVIGAMFVFYHRSHQFSDDEVRLLTTIANQAATALENARLFAETSRRVRELQLLHRVGLAAASGVRLEETLQVAAEALAAEFEGIRVGIGLLDPESDVSCLEVSAGYPPGVVKNLHLRLGEGITGWVAQHGESLLVPDVRLDPRYIELVSDIRSELCVPLAAGSLIIGVISVESAQPNAFTEDDQRLLSTLASNLAVFIGRARLFEEVEAARVELQERAQALEEANVRLQELDRLKNQFLANMSHELRTPLNSVIGFSEVLIDGLVGEMTCEQTECLGNIHSSGKHLLALINDVLDLSKIEAGRVELELTPFDVAQLLAEVEMTIAPLIKKKSQVLEIEQADGLPPLTADRFRVKQILLNLLSNAHKFTPVKGCITLCCRPVDQATLLFSVADTGIGIKPGDRGIIFEEFRQADGSVTREITGTGLGLAISKRLVEMHGGRIWVESEYGHGATFSFLLLLAGPPVAGRMKQYLDARVEGAKG
ncbi:MAG: GAF domain-containing protein [Chloroflexota bacterium]|nr:GAF domain-containing protein [Chloroflexota bacterium]